MGTPRTDAAFGIPDRATREVEIVALAAQLERELSIAQSEGAELRKAVRAFVKRHDEISPALDGVFTFYAVHGMKWPEVDNWKRELDALRDAIKESP